MKLLEREKDDVRKERDAIKDQLSKLEREKDNVRKERDAIKDQLSKNTAYWDMKEKRLQVEHTTLEKEVIVTKASRDAAIQQQASSDIKVKQLEIENNVIRLDKNIVERKLSELTAKVEQLRQKKAVITRRHKLRYFVLCGLILILLLNIPKTMFYDILTVGLMMIVLYAVYFVLRRVFTLGVSSD